ncbi:hypothetical protein [Haloarcula argentinensis]|uniref:Uncharacterized protein n=1 Tax=Haloarcula argentinensis TaxID=43776 RepID=A0A847U6M7_HALAR|nr:hypothetical protein [Haloarcula argentinensis]NLV13932.1 hypothetical protein [Haloarcula argentinensis]
MKLPSKSPNSRDKHDSVRERLGEDAVYSLGAALLAPVARCLFGTGQ